MRVLGNASDDANGLLVLANINDCTRRIPPSSFHQGIHHASVPFLKRHSTIRHRITMLDYIKRENRVKQPIAFHQERIEGLLQQVQNDKVQDTLAYHRRKLTFLRDRERELVQKRRRIIREGMREVEEHRQAAIRRYGVQDELESGSIGNFHDPHAQERRACVSHPWQPPKSASRGNLVQGPSTASELSRARADQTTYEHARLTKGRPLWTHLSPRTLGPNNTQHPCYTRRSSWSAYAGNLSLSSIILTQGSIWRKPSNKPA
jgi:hypothetical protein